jgi:uncharacterized protein (TIGR03083 family)
MMDLVALYTATQARVIELVSPLSPPLLGTLVPATPRWTINQLIMHVTGVCADLGAGIVEGVGSEAWTDRQVTTRREQPLPDVLAEWRDRTPTLLERLATPGRVDASAFDLLTHEHDLRGCLGLAGPSDPEAVFLVTERVTGRLGHLVTKAALPTLRLVNDDSEWVCGPGDAEVTGTASTMEWFRALFGRRSRAQVLTYAWRGEPQPYFDLLNLFGPLPAVDVAEAGAPVPVGRP